MTKYKKGEKVVLTTLSGNYDVKIIGKAKPPKVPKPKKKSKTQLLEEKIAQLEADDVNNRLHWDGLLCKEKKAVEELKSSIGKVTTELNEMHQITADIYGVVKDVKSNEGLSTTLLAIGKVVGLVEQARRRHRGSMWIGVDMARPSAAGVVKMEMGGGGGGRF